MCLSYFYCMKVTTFKNYLIMFKLDCTRKTTCNSVQTKINSYIWCTVLVKVLLDIEWLPPSLNYLEASLFLTLTQLQCTWSHSAIQTDLLSTGDFQYKHLPCQNEVSWINISQMETFFNRQIPINQKKDGDGVADLDPDLFATMTPTINMYTVKWR